MTLSGFRSKSDKNATNNGGSETRSPASREEPTALTAYIDQGVEFSGKLSSKGSVRIDGRIVGEVKCGQTAIIGQSAHVEAKIEADTAIISGEVRGDINAKKKITLDKNARVTGNLVTPGIVIEEGARLRGQIMIGSEEELAEAKVSEASSASKNRGAGDKRRVAPGTPAARPQL